MRRGEVRRSGFIPLLLISACVLLANAALFRTGLYERIVSPDSTFGMFDGALSRVDRVSTDRARDVLVLGDSRIYSGFDSETAARSTQNRFHFLNAGVPGTTPRCWYVFDRALDPKPSRYRAVVLPVDTYSDDDGAIGSVDGDDHAADLHYLALRTSLLDLPKIAGSFSTLNGKAGALFELLLRGPLLRDDIQAAVADPGARLDQLKRTPATPVLREGSLVGLTADFKTGSLAVPPDFPTALRAQLDAQVFHVAVASPSYARYREEWLAPIALRYAEAGIPVIIVRIPTRPIHHAAPPAPSGVLQRLGTHRGITLLDQTYPVSLEQPRYFVDPDHLNAVGGRLFSAWLAKSVASIVDAKAPAAPPASRPAAAPLAPSPIPANVAHHRFPIVARVFAALAIGVPLPFQSIEFLLFFTIVTVAYYALRSLRLRRLLLLIASAYFYARWNAYYVAVLAGLVVTDYSFGIATERARGVRRRVVLWLGVAANLAFLGTAKYADFLTGTIASAFGLASDPWALHVLVPIGISFHTFQSISYLVDVYRGKVRATRSILDYALYLAFFPQLLAGPIVRSARFFREWYGKQRRPGVSSRDLYAGCSRVALGLVKKCVVADRFAASADAYFLDIAAHPGSLAALGAIFAFAVQIYFDFSGYTDIAIGLARILGFRFPENFRRPYLAWSVGEFWRRWHMTLSSWLRDYVYVSLGGNRHGLGATLRNLMLTMLLGGLWHGANWTFVAWGAYHGVLLCAERVSGFARFTERNRASIAIRIGATTLTFVAVCVGWILFRAQTFAQAAAVIRNVFTFSVSEPTIGFGMLALLVPFALLEVVAETSARRRRPRPLLVNVLAGVGILFVLELGTYSSQNAQFIYFRF